MASFHNSPFSFIIFIFVLLSCFSCSLQAFKNGWHYLETDRESSNFEKLNVVVNELRREHVKIWTEDTKRVVEKCLYNKYICWKVTLLPLACWGSLWDSFQRVFLSASHRLSHANCTVGRKLGTEVGVNSCLVALIATESVSIALSWLLLPPEVGVNRHGH